MLYCKQSKAYRKVYSFLNVNFGKIKQKEHLRTRHLLFCTCINVYFPPFTKRDFGAYSPVFVLVQSFSPAWLFTKFEYVSLIITTLIHITKIVEETMEKNGVMELLTRCFNLLLRFSVTNKYITVTPLHQIGTKITKQHNCWIR